MTRKKDESEKARKVGVSLPADLDDELEEVAAIGGNKSHVVAIALRRYFTFRRFSKDTNKVSNATDDSDNAYSKEEEVE